MKIVGNYTKAMEELSKAPKKFYLVKLASFIMALIIVLPFVLIDINLLQMYYDLEMVLFIFLSLMIIALAMLYTKFVMDASRHNEYISDKDKIRSIYIVNLTFSIIMAIVVFTLYTVIRRMM